MTEQDDDKLKAALDVLMPWAKDDPWPPEPDPTAFEIDFDPLVQRMSGVAIHGNVPFDVPFISELDDNLWQGGCEYGLILPTHIQHLLSLYPWEKYTIEHEMLSEKYVEMYDSESQAFDQVIELAREVNENRKTGPVLVHCQAGLNRSSLVAATALVLDGVPARDAVAQIRDRRSPACLCNPSFENWLLFRLPRILEAQDG